MAGGFVLRPLSFEILPFAPRIRGISPRLDPSQRCRRPPVTRTMKKIVLTIFMTASAFSQETLKDRLDARSAEAAKAIPEEIRSEFAKGIKVVEESGILKSAKQVGDRAPEFTLRDPLGKQVRLSDLIKKGPVILTWYRGGWCPYCNIALAAYQEKLGEFEAAGATLVALTPELPDKSLSTVEKQKLAFPVLTDLNHKVAKSYGIVFELTPKVQELYRGFFDLNEFNGKEAGDKELPLSATYIIDQKGMIRWAFLDANYRNRAEPAEVLGFLRKLKPKKD